MRGLDPRIHQEKKLLEMMDCRVKPGNGSRKCRPAFPRRGQRVTMAPRSNRPAASMVSVIASQRVGAKRRPMTGSAKQSRVLPQKRTWIASSLCSS
jgi:hypothetical protein